VLLGRGLCDGLITRPKESYRLWCVVVCDQETSRMRSPWPALDRSATEKKIIMSDVDRWNGQMNRTVKQTIFTTSSQLCRLLFKENTNLCSIQHKISRASNYFDDKVYVSYNGGRPIVNSDSPFSSSTSQFLVGGGLSTINKTRFCFLSRSLHFCCHSSQSPQVQFTSPLSEPSSFNCQNNSKQATLTVPTINYSGISQTSLTIPSIYMLYSCSRDVDTHSCGQ